MIAGIFVAVWLEKKPDYFYSMIEIHCKKLTPKRVSEMNFYFIDWTSLAVTF